MSKKVGMLLTTKRLVLFIRGVTRHVVKNYSSYWSATRSTMRISGF